MAIQPWSFSLLDDISIKNLEIIHNILSRKLDLVKSIMSYKKAKAEAAEKKRRFSRGKGKFLMLYKFEVFKLYSIIFLSFWMIGNHYISIFQSLHNT